MQENAAKQIIHKTPNKDCAQQRYSSLTSSRSSITSFYPSVPTEGLQYMSHLISYLSLLVIRGLGFMPTVSEATRQWLWGGPEYVGLIIILGNS